MSARAYTPLEFHQATSGDPDHYIGDADANRLAATVMALAESRRHAQQLALSLRELMRIPVSIDALTVEHNASITRAKALLAEMPVWTFETFHTAACREQLQDPGAGCVCRPPAVAEVAR